MKKNSIKKLMVVVLSTLAISSFGTSLWAKKPMHPPQIDQQQVLSQLDLSEDVKADLMKIMQQQKEWVDTLHDRVEDDRYQAHQERRNMQEAHRAQVKALLTQDQFAAFEKAMWMQHHQPRMGDMPPPRR